jgi:hypothetical protein
MFPRLLCMAVFSLCALRLSAGEAAATARAATPGEISLLNEVLHKVADDLRRWAYTEHRVLRDSKGRVKSEQIVRYDPSKPYAEQWMPLKIDGRAPSTRELAKFRRRGEETDPEKPIPTRRRTPTLGEAINVNRSTIAEESATHWVFEIPLRTVGNDRFPPTKFRVQARIKKDGLLLENISVLLRESFRSLLVVKVKSGDASLEFTPIDPRFPPTLVAIAGDADWSVMFVGSGRSIDLKRTELKHVKPYDERFEVKIGTLKAIDF